MLAIKTTIISLDKARITVTRSYKVEDFVWTHPTTRVNN